LAIYPLAQLDRSPLAKVNLPLAPLYPQKRTFVSASGMSTIKSLNIGGYLLK
jgi:hypothetical protein